MATGRRRPLLLVFEDGHWADTPTLLLLRHLAAGATEARMLLVATFRDTEADVPAELSEALIDMRRSDGVVRVRVGALTGEQVSEFVERAAGAPLGPALPELAGAITSLTQGNVFLVTELWRELVETGALEIVDGVAILTRPLSALGTPESVREVVNQRLARLQPETALVLELAAVTGPEFDLSVLRGGGFTDATLSAALDQSLRSGIIDKTGEELRYRLPRARARRFVRPGSRARAGRSCTCRWRSRWRRPARPTQHAGWQTSPTTSPPPHRSMFPSGRSSVSCGRLNRVAALAFGEAVGPLRTALELGVDNETAHAEIELELGAAHYRAGVRRLPGGVPGGRRDGAAAPHPISWRAPHWVETACWRVAMLHEGAIELLEEALPGSMPATPRARAAAVGAGPGAPSWASPSAAPSCATRRSRSLGGWTTARPVLVVMRSYWVRG